jgi:rubrerythrin
MPILTPTRAVGATARAVGWSIPDPVATVTPADSKQAFPAELDGGFLADLLSSMLTHERCGVHLYRSVATRAVSSTLRERFEEFGGETLRHVEILEELIGGAGGNPAYLSPSARGTEARASKLLDSTFLLAGSIDPVTAELGLVEAVFLAETIDQANWQAMARLRDALPEGDLRAAVQRALEEVAPQEDEHLEWAKIARARLISGRLVDLDGESAALERERLDSAMDGWLLDEPTNG